MENVRCAKSPPLLQIRQDTVGQILVECRVEDKCEMLHVTRLSEETEEWNDLVRSGVIILGVLAILVINEWTSDCQRSERPE